MKHIIKSTTEVYIYFLDKNDGKFQFAKEKKY